MINTQPYRHLITVSDNAVVNNFILCYIGNDLVYPCT